MKSNSHLTHPWRTGAMVLGALALMFGAVSAQAQGHGGRGGGFAHGGPAFHGGGHFVGAGRGWGPGPFWGGIGLGLGLGYYYGAPYSPYYYPSYPAYVVTDPSPVIYDAPVPAAAPAAVTSTGAVPPAEPSPVIYPRNHQSAAKTEADRRACSDWAHSQPNAASDASVYPRALAACMDGRGYTVR